jgi:hypothetical protein
VNLCVGENKKADVEKHPEMLPHVGLLFNDPPGTSRLLFTSSSDDGDREFFVVCFHYREHVTKLKSLLTPYRAWDDYSTIGYRVIGPCFAANRGKSAAPK